MSYMNYVTQIFGFYRGGVRVVIFPTGMDTGTLAAATTYRSGNGQTMFSVPTSTTTEAIEELVTLQGIHKTYMGCPREYRWDLALPYVCKYKNIIQTATGSSTLTAQVVIEKPIAEKYKLAVSYSADDDFICGFPLSIPPTYATRGNRRVAPTDLAQEITSQAPQTSEGPTRMTTGPRTTTHTTTTPTVNTTA